MNDKNTYYLHINASQLLGGKELLKSMPMFYNKVYFTKNHANTLWNGESNDTFECITLLCHLNDLPILRNIIRNNFLYLKDWDSLTFTDEDYGFSFIAGNIKYILMGYIETDTGYIIKSYNVDTGECATTDLKDVNKKYFLDVSVNENSEFIRTVLFDMTDINDSNTKKKLAEKKIKPEMATYNSGFLLTDVLLAIALLSSVVSWGIYLLLKFLA